MLSQANIVYHGKNKFVNSTLKFVFVVSCSVHTLELALLYVIFCCARHECTDWKKNNEICNKLFVKVLKKVRIIGK